MFTWSRGWIPPLHSASFCRAVSALPLPVSCLSFKNRACKPWGEKKKEAVQQHFKFDHRSFIVKHEYNQSICTKRLLLQITWLPPRGQALQLEVLADVDGMEGCWDPRTLTFTGRAWSSSSVSSWSCTWNQDRKIKHVRGGEHLLTRMCHPVKYYCILSI